MDKRLGNHVSEPFNQELGEICNKVLSMGKLVEQQIELAIEAFKTGNVEQAKQVIKQGQRIDDLEIAIDNECTQIIALRQPAAIDLKLIITVIHIINEIERIGDKAESIANVAIRLANFESKTLHDDLEKMADLVKQILHEVLEAFDSMTLKNLSSLAERKNNVHTLYQNIFLHLSSLMTENPKNISSTLDLLFTFSELERIGDHACNICECLHQRHLI